MIDDVTLLDGLSGTVAAVSSIIGDDVTCGQFSGGIVSLGYNVTETESGCSSDGPGDVVVDDVFATVLDATLADNGGPTLTHALLDPPGNPAVGIGGTCGPTDQRGFPAPEGGTCDAGAVELGSDGGGLMVEALPREDPLQTQPGQRFQFAVAITVPEGGPTALDGWGEAITPSGDRRLVLGPRPVRVTPGETTTVSTRQTVPRRAEPGTYTYVVNVGTYPEAEAADAFQIQVSPSDGVIAAAWPETWEQAATWEEEALPEALALGAPVPNPARGTVSLGYDLAEAGPVRLDVLDALGRRVASLAAGHAEAGRQHAHLDVSTFAPGAYVVRLEAGGRVLTRRFTVVR